MHTSKYLLTFAVKPLLEILTTAVKVTGISGIVTLAMTVPSYAITTFATGLNNPAQLAFDSSGNAYVANEGSNNIIKITSGGSQSTFATGLSNPIGLAFDSSGNLYVANSGNNTVSKVTTGGTVSTFASGFNGPEGVAFDSSGNLYVSNETGANINKVTTGGTVSTFASGIGTPYAGIAFDASGNLYVGIISNNTISEISTGGTVSTFASGLSGPNFIAIHGGNLYESDGGTGTIQEFTLPAAVPFEFSSTLGLSILGVFGVSQQILRRVKIAK